MADTFRPDEDLIRAALERFLKGRMFMPIPGICAAASMPKTTLLEDWFFNQGDAPTHRGTQPRNILASAALIAIIGEALRRSIPVPGAGRRPRTAGEWRRGLQDALGLGREDFGPQRHRAVRTPGSPGGTGRPTGGTGEVPLILIDAAERV